MGRIEDYRFGRVTVDGVEHTRDLIVLPDRVVANWRRRQGHSLVIDDLEDVLDELPPHLVVGCGHDGRLRPDPAVSGKLAEHGIEMDAAPTAAAIEIYESLERRNPAAIAAALHLTC